MNQIHVSIDALLMPRLSEYVSRGFDTRDALVRSLADVAQQMGIPGIILTTEQFEALAQTIEERTESWERARDTGATMVGVVAGEPVEARVVSQDEYESVVGKEPK